DLVFAPAELDFCRSWDVGRVLPQVFQAGHHRRELRDLPALVVEDSQARKLLNDLAAYTAANDLGALDRDVVARRWLSAIYTPIVELVPDTDRGTLAPAEYFHEVMEHRWALSEVAGREVDIFDAARDYVATVLPARPPDAPSGLR